MKPEILTLWPGKLPGAAPLITGPEADRSKPGEGMTGGKTVIRLGNVSQPELHVFLPSGEELWLLTGTKPGDAGAATAALLHRGVGLVVHKQGSAGASAQDKHGTITCPAVPVIEVDPTGAGDCFGAAFVTGWRAGLPLPQALRRACAAGAHAVTRRGPMEGAASAAELDAFQQ